MCVTEVFSFQKDSLQEEEETTPTSNMCSPSSEEIVRLNLSRATELFLTHIVGVCCDDIFSARDFFVFQTLFFLPGALIRFSFV